MKIIIFDSDYLKVKLLARELADKIFKEKTGNNENKIKFTILTKEQVESDRSNANDYLFK